MSVSWFDWSCITIFYLMYINDCISLTTRWLWSSKTLPHFLHFYVFLYFSPLYETLYIIYLGRYFSNNKGSWGEWLKFCASFPHVLNSISLLPFFITVFFSIFHPYFFMIFSIFLHHPNDFFFWFFDTYFLFVTLSSQFNFLKIFFPIISLDYGRCKSAPWTF